jgi:CheY-like chemotaxis protein
MSDLVEVLRALSALVWTCLAAAFLLILRQPLGEAIGRLEQFEGLGFKLSLTPLREAVVVRPGRSAEVDIRMVGGLLRRHRRRLDEAEILWIDDSPSGNRLEARMLQALGARIAFAASSEEAARALDLVGGPWPAFDLVISDIERDDRPVGIDFMREQQKRGRQTPFIFYVGAVKGAAPDGSSGIADNPLDLAKLVTAALAVRDA